MPTDQPLEKARRYSMDCGCRVPNLVQPEDGPTAIAAFSLQMAMLDYLHGVYTGVPIALYAGELVPGLAPPEALTFHIRDAIEACGYDGLGRRLLSDPCRQFLADSPKARLQWGLKAALAEFESDLARDDRPFIPAAAYPEPALAN